MLAINEEFYSIQGEGLHTGIPMYFVRLQGCDVGCYFCDTKYTWRDKNPDVHEGEIVGRAIISGAKWMCITGGEPYQQDLKKLVYLAKNHPLTGLKTQVETSGAAPWQDVGIDWVTLSPKDLFTKERFQAKEEYKQNSNEIKCVVTKEKDIDYYISEYYDYCNNEKPLIFQLVDNETKFVTPIMSAITERGLKYARCMMQMHKIMELR